MKRIRQTFEEIFESLMPVESSWRDAHAEQVINALKTIKDGSKPGFSEVQEFLDQNFNTGLTVVRLFLDLSKDEFLIRLGSELDGSGGVGVKRYLLDRQKYLSALQRMGLFSKMKIAINHPLHWSDVLVERLKGGRGSAIKGQQRGRLLEDFVEVILKKVFSINEIAARCRFTGASGLSTEKAYFAIPSAEDPLILIEVKAYGATGSKQTDVLGDIARIVEEKRNDTSLFLFTDGITWRERTNDLRKLIRLQNEGKIQKIYTRAMADDFEADIRSLKQSF